MFGFEKVFYEGVDHCIGFTKKTRCQWFIDQSSACGMFINEDFQSLTRSYRSYAVDFKECLVE